MLWKWQLKSICANDIKVYSLLDTTLRNKTIKKDQFNILSFEVLSSDVVFFCDELL